MTSCRGGDHCVRLAGSSGVCFLKVQDVNGLVSGGWLRFFVSEVSWCRSVLCVVVLVLVLEERGVVSVFFGRYLYNS